MKNTRLKNSFVAAGVAIMAGVLLFSVNAAVGDAPSYSPPGSGVSPVFTDFTATGNGQIDGQLLVGSNLGVTTNAIIGNALQVGGNFIGTGNTNRFDGDLEVDGTLEVVENIEMSSAYSISASGAGGVNIDDGLEVSGDMTLSGDMEFTGSMTNSGSSCSMAGCTYYPVYVDDKLQASGDIITTSVGDFGSVDTAEIKNVRGSGGGPLTVSDSLTVNGNSTDINSNNVYISGNLKLDGGGIVGSYYDIYKSLTGASFASTSCLSGDVLVACHGYTSSSGINLRYAYGWGNSCYVKYNSTGNIGSILKCWDPAGSQTATIYR